MIFIVRCEKCGKDINTEQEKAFVSEEIQPVNFFTCVRTNVNPKTYMCEKCYIKEYNPQGFKIMELEEEIEKIKEEKGFLADELFDRAILPEEVIKRHRRYWEAKRQENEEE